MIVKKNNPLALNQSESHRDSRDRPSQRPALALIIPTLREARNIRSLLRRVQSALDPRDVAYEVIVVDDDSGDGIEQAVAEFAAADSRFRLIVRRGQRGLAGAVLRGWAETDAAFLAVMDADLQHPPELLPRLWSHLHAGADLVIGSRYASGGSLGGWTPMRHLLSKIAVWMTLPVQRPGIRARDPMSGFFIVRRQSVDGLQFQESGFKILLEILARGRVRSVVEVPFAFGRRDAGASKAGFRVALDYVTLLLRLYRHKRRAPAYTEPGLAGAALESTQEAIGG